MNGLSGGEFAFFPGQGSQQVGMGKDLCENFKIAREVFEEASDAISMDLKKICFEGPESDLTLTQNTQPCLLTTSIAAFRVMQEENGLRPTGYAGHSLGEYSALVAAGALPLGATARWVRERGLAMQAAVPAGQGTMAAILNLDDAKVIKLCETATAAAELRRMTEKGDFVVEACVQPANFNSPGQIVIAGSTDAIQQAVDLVKAGDEFAGKAIPLSVSAPFHCKLMAPARARMAQLFAGAEKPSRLTAPYVANRTGRITSEPGVIFELLVEQIDHPVLWKQSMEAALAAGATKFIEIGPGKVLCGLLKRIAQNAGKTVESRAVCDTNGIRGGK